MNVRARRRARAALFAYAMGLSSGGALGVFAGSFTIGWGLALAPLVVCAIFAFGLWRERDERFRHALRFVAALTTAFLVILVPTVLIDLATPVDEAWNAAERHRRAELLHPLLVESLVRWAVMALAIPFAFWRLRSNRNPATP